MIHIIDYGVGNIQAFLNVYKRLGITARRTINPADIQGATHIILPGVGSFDRAMGLFNQSGFRGALEQIVQEGSTKVIGVCVGMQMLAGGSDEGNCAGLGWIEGRVRSLDALGGEKMPSPHMGWNDVEPRQDHPLFAGMDDHRFYFLHSYFFANESAETAIGSVCYRSRFTCAVGKGNVFGVQFHPEKSHHWGQQLLGNFARL